MCQMILSSNKYCRVHRAEYKCALIWFGIIQQISGINLALYTSETNALSKATSSALIYFPTLQVEKSQILFTTFICCQGLTKLVRDFLPSALGHLTHVIYTNRKHNYLILTARELSTHSKHLQCSRSHAWPPGGMAQCRPLPGQASLNAQFFIIPCSVSSLTKSWVTSHERLASYKNV